ncbi:hypothetical protein [Rhizobium sp. AG855]|uniref:hypothetical protein n=1 Tax=Rhizobium sp. AG855 TaxID=2183898 RepID=UPI000E70F54E|nr:hypothetical protein [Rhizobium sp. AG855]RKE84600.1 hypothetical protein DFO46_1370 [Rhizobium sp. AG855]
MVVLTKPAQDVFNPFDIASNPRGADMGEAQTWGMEIEADLAEIRALVASAPTSATKNLREYGAVGDGKWTDTQYLRSGLSITSGSASLTLTFGEFRQSDVGKTIVVPGAGAAGGDLVTTISAVTSRTQLTLGANASTTLSNVAANVTYGSSPVTTTAGQAFVTVVGANFTAADVNKKISIPGAGAAGTALLATIVSVGSSSNIVLNANASTSLAGRVPRVTWGTDDTAAVQAAFNALVDGDVMLCPPGDEMAYLVTGNVQLPLVNAEIFGKARFKKLGPTTTPMFLPADETDGITFRGLRFDGARENFVLGDPVSIFLGHIIHSWTFIDCRFERMNDSGIKGRDCANLTAIGCVFYDARETGIELRNYDRDPRRGSTPGTHEYLGRRPLNEGGHRVIGCRFELIDTETFGNTVDDSMGISWDSSAYSATYGPHAMSGFIVYGCTFIDVRRSFFSENYGQYARDIHFIGNRVLGNLRGYPAAKTKNGIGLVAVKGAIVSANTMRNVGNMPLVIGTADCSSIVIAGGAVGSSMNIKLCDNNLIDDSGNTTRTDYHINVSAGADIELYDNTLSGASEAGLIIAATGVSNITGSNNKGAFEDFSWGPVAVFQFAADNVPASANPFYVRPINWAGDTDFGMPMTGRIVGIGVKLSQSLTAGSFEVAPYIGASKVSTFAVTRTDLGGLAELIRKTQTGGGVLIKAGERISIRAVTDGSLSPTTSDILVTLIIDISGKA